MGEPVEDEVVRAMVLLRARTLALGHSGARPLVAEGMVNLLNAGISPVVPEYGSLGASGDLAPLAHGALALLGEGEVMVDGVRRPAAQALAEAGLEPIELAEKEGLAVTNGTDAILGMLCLAIDDTRPSARPGRRDHRHDRGGPAGQRLALRSRPSDAPPPTGPGGVGRQPGDHAGRLANRGQP
jgi:histidine ammonia-lyase